MIASIAHVHDVIGMLQFSVESFSRFGIVLESSILESSIEKVYIPDGIEVIPG
jgi:hypothetical protein